jgi:transcriptional regulator with XRE-family HTH domain
MITKQKIPTRKTVGQQIKERMRELDITQQNLADRLGVTRSYIWQVLNGEQNLTLDRLDEIAGALNRSTVRTKIK